MQNANRIAGALALVAGLGSAFAEEVTVKDTHNLIDDGIVTAPLNRVRSQPDAFLKSRVKFTVRFDKLGEIHQPFFTIFDSHTHTNFSAWDEANDLKTADGYLDNCALLYLDRRRGDEMEALIALHKFQRFECVGIVQSVFGGNAFIEVLTLRPLNRTWAPDMHKRDAFSLPQPIPHSHNPDHAEPCDCGYYPKAAATETQIPIVTATDHPDVIEVKPAPAAPPQVDESEETETAPEPIEPIEPIEPPPASGTSEQR